LKDRGNGPGEGESGARRGRGRRGDVFLSQKNRLVREDLGNFRVENLSRRKKVIRGKSRKEGTDREVKNENQKQKVLKKVPKNPSPWRGCILVKNWRDAGVTGLSLGSPSPEEKRSCKKGNEETRRRTKGRASLERPGGKSFQFAEGKKNPNAARDHRRRSVKQRRPQALRKKAKVTGYLKNGCPTVFSGELNNQSRGTGAKQVRAARSEGGEDADLGRWQGEKKKELVLGAVSRLGLPHDCAGVTSTLNGEGENAALRKGPGTRIRVSTGRKTLKGTQKSQRKPRE